MTPQLLNLSPEEYHSDPCDEPSLNSSVAVKMVLQTPAHAREAHPRVATDYQPAVSNAFDEGTAIHQMLLGDDRCDILVFDDYRSKAAQEQRDISRAAGRTPILSKKWDELAKVGDALKRQVAEFQIQPPLFTEGIAEQSIIWEERGISCRARLDWLTNDYRFIDDLKKARSSEPRRFQKSMWGYGYDIKAAFYIRAVRAVFDVDPVFRWVAIEPTPPYAMSVHVLSPQALYSAHEKVDLAMDLWRECLDTGVWPGYAQTVQIVEQPPWAEAAVWDDTALTEAPF